MAQTNQHSDTQQMLRAIETGDPVVERHISACESCRYQYNVLRKLSQSLRTPVESVSEEALRRFSNIPALGRQQVNSAAIQGVILRDSWRDSAHHDVRDVTFGHVRRLCLGAGAVSVELVAERRREGWSFVARAYSQDEVCSQFVLKVGAKKMLPNASGFYQWSSARAPRKISLHTVQKQIEFTGLAWS